MDITVSVIGQEMYVTPENLRRFAHGSKNFVRFIFDLSEDWNGMIVSAQFAQENEGYNRLLDNSNSVYMPQELVPGPCLLMLYGVNGTATIGTTNSLQLMINDNGYLEDPQSTSITPSLYSQLAEQIQSIRAAVGSPLVAANSSDMQNRDKIYVYTGSQSGYEYGHWYYYNTNNGAWTDGGAYNSLALSTDTTLTLPGEAADAFETGKWVNQASRSTSYQVERDITFAFQHGVLNSRYGSWEGSTHASYDKRLMNADGFLPSITTRVRIQMDNTAYKFYVLRYSTNAATSDTATAGFLGSEPSVGTKWCTSGDVYVDPSAEGVETWLRISVARKDDTETMDASDLAAVTAAFHMYDDTDKTLSVMGRAADAAAVNQLEQTIGCVDLDLALYDTISRRITGTAVSTAGSSCEVVRKTGWTSIKVTSGTQNAYITFLTASVRNKSNNASISGILASGETGRHQVAKGGNTETFNIPYDCTIINIQTGYNNQNYTPAKVVAYYDGGLQSMIDEVFTYPDDTYWANRIAASTNGHVRYIDHFDVLPMDVYNSDGDVVRSVMASDYIKVHAGDIINLLSTESTSPNSSNPDSTTGGTNYSNLEFYLYIYNTSKQLAVSNAQTFTLAYLDYTDQVSGEKNRFKAPALRAINGMQLTGIPEGYYVRIAMVQGSTLRLAIWDGYKFGLPLSGTTRVFPLDQQLAVTYRQDADPARDGNGTLVWNAAQVAQNEGIIWYKTGGSETTYPEVRTNKTTGEILSKNSACINRTTKSGTMYRWTLRDRASDGTVSSYYYYSWQAVESSIQFALDGSCTVQIPGLHGFVVAKPGYTFIAGHSQNKANRMNSVFFPTQSVRFDTGDSSNLTLVKDYDYSNPGGGFSREVQNRDLSDYIVIIDERHTWSVDKPADIAHRRVLSNIKALTSGFQWTVKGPLKLYSANSDAYYTIDNTYYGVPYRSSWTAAHYIGWHTTKHTFINAANDPNSIFYAPAYIKGGFYSQVCTPFSLLVSGFTYPETNFGLMRDPNIDWYRANRPVLCEATTNGTGHIVVPVAIYNASEDDRFAYVLSEGVMPTSMARPIFSDVTTSNQCIGPDSTYADNYRYVVYPNYRITTSDRVAPYNIVDGAIRNGGVRPYKGDQSVYTSAEDVTANVYDASATRLYIQKYTVATSHGQISSKTKDGDLRSYLLSSLNPVSVTGECRRVTLRSNATIVNDTATYTGPVELEDGGVYGIWVNTDAEHNESAQPPASMEFFEWHDVHTRFEENGEKIRNKGMIEYEIRDGELFTDDEFWYVVGMGYDIIRPFSTADPRHRRGYVSIKYEPLQPASMNPAEESTLEEHHDYSRYRAKYYLYSASGSPIRAFFRKGELGAYVVGATLGEDDEGDDDPDDDSGSEG